MATILKYPKKVFTKKEVLKEKKRMRYPKAWKFSSSDRGYKLVLNKKSFKKHYVK